jgi:hypothetical protein
VRRRNRGRPRDGAVRMISTSRCTSPAAPGIADPAPVDLGLRSAGTRARPPPRPVQPVAVVHRHARSARIGFAEGVEHLCGESQRLRRLRSGGFRGDAAAPRFPLTITGSTSTSPLESVRLPRRRNTCPPIGATPGTRSVPGFDEAARRHRSVASCRVAARALVPWLGMSTRRRACRAAPPPASSARESRWRAPAGSGRPRHCRPAQFTASLCRSAAP